VSSVVTLSTHSIGTDVSKKNLLPSLLPILNQMIKSTIFQRIYLRPTLISFGLICSSQYVLLPSGCSKQLFRYSSFSLLCRA
jgi:hypothetical protein